MTRTCYTLAERIIIRVILSWALSPQPRKRWPRYPVK